ncbi:glycosyltransferase family 2 protein [Leeuwenhoekiella sp. LLG6367-2.1]|uniref:glycosyltransferase family 2 protein n=1 Tax=Leeuwenhoekiella sp. LLG6367-2.1 TaxID=3160833 RepID=UPI0038665343
MLKISVITIVFNNKTTVESCLKAVQSQDYPYIEHIVIDGGSTDGTQQIIENYKDNLGYYISEPDTGLYNALNKGIRASKGDIIGILHSDDFYYSPSTLSEVVAAFESTKTDVLYGNGMFVDRDDPTHIKRVYRGTAFRKSLLNFGWVPLHTTMYATSAVFRKYGMYEEGYRIAGDYEMSLRWFKNPDIKFYFLDRWLVKMRLGGKSTTAALQKKKSTEDLDIILRYRLWGLCTLVFKIARKIPQYIIPRLQTNKFNK